MPSLTVDRINQSDLDSSQHGEGQASVFFEEIEMTGSEYKLEPDVHLFHIKTGYQTRNATHRVDIDGINIETYSLLCAVVTDIGSSPAAMDAIAPIVSNKAKVLAILEEIARET